MATKTKAAKSNGKPVADEDVLWRGPDALRPFLVPIGRLHEDPGNVNTHDDRSIAAIAASYARFGQQKVLVCDDHGVVRDGNGQLRAASERLGWSHVAVVTSDLDGVELTAYGLATNRTAQHARFDFEALAATLKSIQDAGVGIADLGWDEHELEPLLAAEWAPPPMGDLPGVASGEGGEYEGASGGRDGEDDDGEGTPSADHAIPLTPGQRATVDEAIEKVRLMAEDPALSDGRCLELVAVAYLGRPGGDGDDE